MQEDKETDNEETITNESKSSQRSNKGVPPDRLVYVTKKAN